MMGGPEAHLCCQLSSGVGEVQHCGFCRGVCVYVCVEGGEEAGCARHVGSTV